MDSNQFSETAAGIQSVATVAAIIVGGVWTIYTFSTLGTFAKARGELAELEQSAAETPAFSISPDWATDNAPIEEGSWPASERRYNVFLSVLVKNEGKRPLEFADLKVLILRCSNSGEIDKTWNPVQIPARVVELNGDTSIMPLRILTVGQARHIAFLVPPVPAGSYFVELRAIFGRQIETPDQPAIEAVEQHLFEAPSRPVAGAEKHARPRSGQDLTAE